MNSMSPNVLENLPKRVIISVNRLLLEELPLKERIKAMELVKWANEVPSPQYLRGSMVYRRFLRSLSSLSPLQEAHITKALILAVYYQYAPLDALVYKALYREHPVPSVEFDLNLRYMLVLREILGDEEFGGLLKRVIPKIKDIGMKTVEKVERGLWDAVRGIMREFNVELPTYDDFDKMKNILKTKRFSWKERHLLMDLSLVRGLFRVGIPIATYPADSTCPPMLVFFLPTDREKVDLSGLRWLHNRYIGMEVTLDEASRLGGLKIPIHAIDLSDLFVNIGIVPKESLFEKIIEKKIVVRTKGESISIDPFSLEVRRVSEIEEESVPS